MSPLEQSAHALDTLAAKGCTLTVWWRDDDARGPSAALDRLLDLRAKADVPLALAVIPEGAAPALAERIERADVAVLLHGHSHTNHAPADEKRAEFGDHRPLGAMEAEVADGRARLGALFKSQALPVFVPPWNRIGHRLRDALPALNLPVLSVYGPAKTRAELNTHLDIMDWGSMTGHNLSRLDALLAALIRERVTHEQGGREPEPVGLLSHHLQHDTAAWTGLEALLSLTATHPAVHWPQIETLVATQIARQASGGRA